MYIWIIHVLCPKLSSIQILLINSIFIIISRFKQCSFKSLNIFPHSLNISLFIYFSCTSSKDMRILFKIVQMYLINFVGHTSVLLYINVRMCYFFFKSTRAHDIILEVKNIQNIFFC